MSDFIEKIEADLKAAIEQAKQDHEEGAAPDISFIFDEDGLQIPLQEIDQAEVDDVIAKLRSLSNTKEGTRRVISLLSLVAKYAAKYVT